MQLSVCLQLCFLIYWTATAYGQQRGGGLPPSAPPVASPLIVSSDCDVANKFGEDCRYTCHCKAGTACSQDGSCSEGCDDGWFGPTCQKVVLALIATYTKYTNETSKHVLMTYTWDFLFKFTYMELQIKDRVKAGRLKKSLISISFRNQGALQFCEKSIVSLKDDYLYTVHCDTVMFIDSLTVDTEADMDTMYLNIGGEFNDSVEGSTTGNCTSSLVNTTNADVKSKGFLLNHYMFSRLDGQDQLFRLVKYSNSEVYSFNYSGHLTFIYMIHNETVQLIPYKEIFISVFTNGIILELCEVHLFEEIQCAEITRYIVECNRRSNCLNQTDGCLFSIGRCPSGCPVGFTDECCTSTSESTTYAPPKTCPIRKPNRNFIDKTKVV